MKCRKLKISGHVRKNHRFFQTKAQANEIFTWIIALVLLTFLILFGYKSINSLREKGEQAQYLEFRNKIENIVGSTMDYGSGRKISQSLPGDYEGICFIGKNPIASQITDPIIKGHVEQGLRENVFLTKTMAEPPAIYIGEIDVNDNDGKADGVLCLKARAGKVSLQIDGFGTYARISSG